MSVSIFLSIIGGIFLGRAMLGWGIWLRRGVPAVLLVFGAILFRQSVSALGAEAVEAGALDSGGLAGIMLILLGLMSLMTMTLINLGAQLGIAQRRWGRRK